MNQSADTPMSIMLVHDSHEAGGLESVMLQLAAHLRDRVDVIVMARGYMDDGWSTPASFITAIEQLHIPVVRPETGAWRSKRLRQLSELWSTLRLMRRLRPSVVHIHTCSVEGARVQTAAARVARIPVIRTEHNSPTAFSRKPFDSGARRLADRMTGRVLTVSEHDRQQQIEVVGRAPGLVRCVHNGVDVDEFRPPPFETTAPATVTVGTLGRLVEQKNHKSLVAAMRLVADTRADVVCLIAGEGPLRSSLDEQIRRLQLEQVVHLVGETDQAAAFCRALDIGVMTSTHEGFSMVALEMMACGLPVVVTDHPSFGELVDDGVTGVVVPLDDVTALAAAIVRLADDSALRVGLGTAARQKVADRFSVDAHVARVLDEYLIARGHA